jgi:branched-chain amino acid transport system substrate-binding protein
MIIARTLALPLLLASLASAASAQELRIGFLNTTTGSLAVIGLHMENGWKLGLESEGWRKDGDKLGGVATKITYGDDQSKTDVGVREVERMIKGERVHIVAGVLVSNVMMAISKTVFDANVSLLSTNAGPAPLAGEGCSPLFASASFMNDQNAEATGELATRDGVKTVYMMAPNFQAGRDNIAGFQRTYKGKVAGSILYKLGESDFQADFSKVRAAAPEAVYVFAPGSMGISFLKQWQSSGLAKTTKLYALYVIDYATLPAIGDAAIGTIQTSHWNPDLPHPRNQAFIKAYIAKFNHHPSLFAAQGYDGARAIAAAVKSLGGKVDEPGIITKTIRKMGLASVRGDLKYNVNGFPIQPYWKLEIVAGPDGKPIKKGREMVFERKDSFWEKCPEAERL